MPETPAYSATEIDRLAKLAGQHPMQRAVLVWPIVWGFATVAVVVIWSDIFAKSLVSIAAGIALGGLIAAGICACFAVPAARRTRKARVTLTDLKARLDQCTQQ